MSATRSLRFWKPPSAAKNGTWVVPACVTSGPWPETAAFLMRSSWTSQPTTSTLTLTPVWSSNGLTVFSMSACGCGPLGMIQKLTVVPFFRALAAPACWRRGRAVVTAAAATGRNDQGEYDRDQP